MRPWLVILGCAVGCESSDDDGNDDDPADTDAPDDTDTPEDTDTPDDTDTETTPDDPELDCTFAPCGGDVVGEWTIDGLCFPDLGNPLGGLCKTANYDIDYDATGTMSIRKDNTYTANAVSTLTVTATFPAACNDTVVACSDWDIAAPNMTCTGDVAVECECVQTIGPYPTYESGQWEYDDNDVVFDLFGATTTGDGGEVPGRWAYCQDGDSLVMRLKGGLPIQYVLSR